MVTLLAAISVEGDSECPRPTELEALVAAVKTPGHRARLTQQGDRAIELTLFDEHGDRVATRVLRAATCQGLLEAGAATLLAWEARLPPAAPTLPSRRLPLTVPSTGAELPPEPPQERTRGWRIDVALAGALIGAAPTAGFAAAALLGPASARWRGRLHATGMLPVEGTAADGVVVWMRPALGLGATVTVLDRPLKLEVGAGFEAGVLVAWGRGFEENSAATVFDPAVETSVRVANGIAPGLEVFLQLALTISIIRQAVQVTGVDVFLPLPPLTAGLRLGVAFGG